MVEKAVSKTKSPQKPAGRDVSKDALATVVIRNEFYRDGYRRMQLIGLIEAGIIILLVLTLMLVVVTLRGHDRYFATTSDGRLIGMVPLDEPNQPTAKVISWSTEAATEIMTFGFNDYRKRLQTSSRFFTRSGWATFNDALTKSNMLELVTSNQQVVTAVPRDAPVVIKEGLLDNRYQWVLQLPMNVTYQVGTKEENRPQLITMVITRVPTLDTPDGIAIDQWIAEDLK